MLYPNPAATQITISFDNWSDNASLEITDISGKIVVGTQKLNNSLTFISLAHLPAGVYLCRIQTASSLLTKRFVVVK